MAEQINQKPTVATFADHEVITPPHKLNKAVAPAGLGGSAQDDPVARAEQALAELSTEFAGWMDAELERLDAARRSVRASGLNAKTREALFHSAHDIKGQAATLGYPAGADAADSLCRLIEHTPDLARIPLALIDQHVDAVRAIVREGARTGAAEVAASLTKKLRAVTDEFLLRENEHRPGYLDGIVAPPLVPQD
jgi:hypothetical protein